MDTLLTSMFMIKGSSAFGRKPIVERQLGRLYATVEYTVQFCHSSICKIRRILGSTLTSITAMWGRIRMKTNLSGSPFGIDA